MEPLPLRDYQRAAIDAVRSVWATGVNRTAVVLPTGAGKTVVFSHMAAEETGRTLVIAHRQELVDQAAAKIRTIAPGFKVGVDMADRRADSDCRAVVASVQTLASEKRRARWEPGAFTQVVVDECHHAVADTYVRVLEYFGCMADGGTRTAGFTATLQRGDGVGLGNVWGKEVAYSVSILEMVRRGNLVNPTGVYVPLNINLSNVKVSAGDYTAKSLDAELRAAGFDQVIAEAYREHAAERQGIVFTPTVATAQDAAAAFCAAGFKAQAVWGDMDKEAREAAIQAFRDGETQILCNCMILTEGFDAPQASCVVMARMTRSASLYIQMAGRVLRPHRESGKTDALVLDLVGVANDHKLRTLVDLAGGELPEQRKGERATDGETLLDAVDRIIGRKSTLGEPQAVDLFASRDSVWLRTKAGYWFIPAGGGYVALYPGPDCCAVALFPPGDVPPRWDPRRIPDIDLAMAVGENEAGRIDRASGRFSTSARGAAWRGRSAPSERQLARAARMRIEVPEGATSGEVSDLITAKEATRRIDRHFASIKKRRAA